MKPARALALMQDVPVASGQPAVSAASGVSVRINPARDVATALAAEWQALSAHASEVNCFAEPWFVAAGLRHLAAEDVLLAEARDTNGMLVGVMPLCVAEVYGRLPVRHVENWRHHHCFLGALLVRAGVERAFWAALIAALDSSRWARGFLHVNGLVEDGPLHRGMIAAAAQLGRPAPTVHRSVRAELRSALSSADYLETTARKKKRKELKRLQNRLAELGQVACRALQADEPLAPWVDAFLSLERAGWKGVAGSALACDSATESFFREVIAGARAAGRLDMLRIELDGRPIAMLVNFIAPPAGFSFKIAYDEAFARFSPGVLIQLENLKVLDRGDIAWMDSCAAANHPMIESLWGERRSIVRVSVPLSGARRRLTYAACRGLESGSAAVRRISRQLGRGA